MDFLRLLLVHVLPKGFRRSRNYGLLHHRRSTLLGRVQLMLRVMLPPPVPITRRPLLCRQCGQPMRIRAVGLAEATRRRSATAAPVTGNGTV